MKENLPIRILILDDNPDNVDIISAWAEAGLPRLLGQAVTVVGVLDGGSALAELESGVFALVITDLLMGGIDGYELVRRIRAGYHCTNPDATSSRVPIITISARAGVEWQYENVYHMVKPLDFRQLSDCVRDLLNQR